SNLKNDALLHQLIHTKLLSPFSNPELSLTHSQREKALAGRVKEVSGKSKLGKGESSTRQEEHNQASQKVRAGLQRKMAERDHNKVEEAKDLGTYHPYLKRQFESESSQAHTRKRARGLGMGVGRFQGGVLKLSRDEIAKATGSNSRAGKGKRRK
ncbi:hypothetical protein CONPUDRAFT_54453, partial [Coniophora puteana RWD-64-598 SS2]